MAKPLGSIWPCSRALPAPTRSAAALTLTAASVVVSATKVGDAAVIRLCSGSGTQSRAPDAETVCVPLRASEASIGASPIQVRGSLAFQPPVKLTGLLA